MPALRSHCALPRSCLNDMPLSSLLYLKYVTDPRPLPPIAASC
jgi:hypothetical protein